MLTFIKALGYFFLEFAKTLVIDTVIKAILNPNDIIKEKHKIGLRSYI